MYTINDLVYICDIVALKEKIDTSTEKSHVNDLDMYSTIYKVKVV